METEIKNINNSQKTRRGVRTFDLVMALLVTATGSLFFLCITRSIGGISFINPWISAMICATVFEVLLSLFAVTVGTKKLIIPIVIIAFLPSIIFTPVVWHIFIVVIAVFITIKGLYLMRHTLFNTLKIDMSMIVRSGITQVGFALIIVITSQYYFFIKNDVEVVLDTSHYVGVSNMIIDFVLKKSNIENISVNTMTVDEFLQFMSENAYTQTEEPVSRVANEDEGMILRWAGQSGVIIEGVKGQVQNQVIEQMRANISDMAGRDISGDEMISNIFPEIISTQINNIMMRNIFLRENKKIIFTAFFFLIILSIMPIIRIVSGLCTRFAFVLLRELKIVRVTKTKRDAEVIVL